MGSPCFVHSGRVQSGWHSSCSHSRSSPLEVAFRRHGHCTAAQLGLVLSPGRQRHRGKQVGTIQSSLRNVNNSNWAAEADTLFFQHDYSELFFDPVDSDSDDAVELAVSLADYIAEVSDQFGIDDLVDIQPGRGGSPVVYLSHPSGHCAQIDLLGAAVTSLRRPSGEELLLTPARAAAAPGHDPARYGVQPVFPTSGRTCAVLNRDWLSEPPADGFLSGQHWSIIGSDADVNPECSQLSIVLATEADEDTLAFWPHQFQATLTIQMSQMTKSKAGRQLSASQPPLELRCRLSIHNKGVQAMAFSGGLCTCLALQEPERAELYNLPWGGVVLNQDQPGAAARVEDTLERCLPLSGRRFDRVYVGARHMSFHPGNFVYRVEVVNRGGFQDIGVRQCSEECAALPQGALVEPIRLRAGGTWEGESVLIVHELTGDYGGRPPTAHLED